MSVILCDTRRTQRLMARLFEDGEPVVTFPQRRLTMDPAIAEPPLALWRFFEKVKGGAP